MTTTSERAQELRALADSLDTVGEAEAAQAKAVERYRENPTEKNKVAYREASQALVEARQAVRGESTVRAVAPGDVSITPTTAGKG